MKILMGEALPYDCDIHVGSHNYADLFAANGHDVCWLGGTLHFFNLLRALRGVPAERQALEIWRSGGQEIRERLQTYHPLTLLPYRKHPILGSRVALNATLNCAIPPLRSQLAKQGFDRPDLLWLSQSHNAPALRRLVTAGKTAYRMSDSYRHFAQTPDSMIEAEKEIIRSVDVVFATARNIEAEAKEIRSEGVHYLPNGVDFAHFHRPDASEPKDFKNLPHPRIVYVGSLSHWFDAELLAHAARAFPNASFPVIGKNKTDLSVIENLPNVSLLGSRPYAELPNYLRHCDVAIIPFQRNELTDATNPVKIFEYFAAGLPVVSVRMLEVEFLNSPALLTETPDAFADAIGAALALGRDRKEFLDFAYANRWENRFELIRELSL